MLLVHLYQAETFSPASGFQVLDFLARRMTSRFQHDRRAVEDQDALCSPELSTFGRELQECSTKAPGRSVYDTLLRQIWFLRGIDSLDTLVRQLRQLIESEEQTSHESITPSSPLGQFCRRCHVEFTRLQFADVQTLWDAFVVYRSPTWDDFARKNPHDVATLLEHDRQEYDRFQRVGSSHNSVTTSRQPNASAVDTDMLVGFAIHQLQKVGTRVPEGVMSRLEAWIDDQVDSGTQCLHFFMAFFEAWRAGQYTMALESLHRYFDYSLAARSGADNMRVYYQYALLHLSVLHAEFECWDESIDAMNECVATGK